ncbi:MAG: hypothetical protein ACE5HA_04880 [Anaerolineae bacterium]
MAFNVGDKVYNSVEEVQQVCTHFAPALAPQIMEHCWGYCEHTEYPYTIAIFKEYVGAGAFMHEKSCEEHRAEMDEKEAATRAFLKANGFE